MSPRPDLGPKPLLGYTASILARVAERRGDDAFLAACAADAKAGVFAIGGELVVMRRTSNGPDPLFRADEARALAPAGETVFLGLVGEAGRFGIALDPEATKGLKGRPDLVVTDLRSIAVQGLVPPNDLAPLAEAKALLAWHARHRFCANCGAPTRMTQAGWKRECPSCKVEHFPRTDPVVIMLAISGDRCLLGRAGASSPTCGRAWRASSSRARASRRRRGARPWRKPASPAGASNTSPRSPGRFRCR
jgi:NAD+ diphosphatase